LSRTHSNASETSGALGSNSAEEAEIEILMSRGYSREQAIKQTALRQNVPSVFLFFFIFIYFC
jgi:hypothetical protein